MAIRNIKFVDGEYYHIYNRGVDKRIIFDDEKDYLRFVILLYLCNQDCLIDMRELCGNTNSIKNLLLMKRKETLVDIGSYCLMSNHFHLLIREKKEGNISIFMQKLLTAYSKYYNSKNERIGSLFQGKFKAKHINSDNYLKYMFSYIHLNPVKMMDSKWKENGIKDRLKTKKFLYKYEYSSYLDFVGKHRVENRILNTKNFPNYFETFGEFNKFVNEWLSFDLK